MNEYVFRLKISTHNEIKYERISVIEECYWKACDKMENRLIKKYGNYKVLNSIMDEMTINDSSKLIDDFSKAKTIIKLLLQDLINKDYDCTKDIEKAEKFIKEQNI